jgi:hypothetical protein
VWVNAYVHVFVCVFGVCARVFVCVCVCVCVCVYVAARGEDGGRREEIREGGGRRGGSASVCG